MAHPGHEISQATSCRRSEGISGMPQIMKVQMGNTNRRDVLLPISRRVEITASHGTAALHDEHKVIRVGADVLGYMPSKVCLQGLRNRHRPTTGTRLRRFSYQALTWQVDQLGRDIDAAAVLLDITPSQSGDLAPPQGAHGSDEDEGPQR